MDSFLILPPSLFPRKKTFYNSFQLTFRFYFLVELKLMNDLNAKDSVYVIIFVFDKKVYEIGSVRS